MGDPKTVKKQPSIYFGCVELKYNRQNDIDNDADTHPWISEDGSYFASRGYPGIAVSKKDNQKEKQIVGLRADISMYTTVYIDPLNPVKNVRYIKDRSFISPCEGPDAAKKRAKIEKIMREIRKEDPFGAEEFYNSIAMLPYDEQIEQVELLLLLMEMDREEKQKAKQLNAGGVNVTIRRSDHLSLDLNQRYGGVTGPALLGVEGGLYLNRNFGDEEKGRESWVYFAIQPLDVFADISFSGDRVNADDVNNGFRLSAGFMESASGYGEGFPFLGGAIDVYFETESEIEDTPDFFGKLSGKIGVLGGIDAASEGYDTYNTIYEGAILLSASAALGMKFNKAVQVGIEGLYGRIGKGDDYSGDWYDNFYTPDIYDDFFGVSPSLRIRAGIFSLRAAYYYLNCSGGDHFGVDYDYSVSIEDDSVTNVSHRVSADMSLRALENNDFKLDVGLRANFYTDDREENFEFFLAPGGMDSGTPGPGYNQMGRNKTYVLPYAKLTIDKFNLEVGGGYSKRENMYDTNCADLCDTGEPGEEGIFDVYLRTGLSW